MKGNILRRAPLADMAARRARLWLCALLLVGLALRVAVTLGEPMGLNAFSDDNAYLNSGAVFLKTGYVTYAAPDVRSGVLGAGMPLTLGLLFALFGYQPTGLLLSHIVFSCIGLAAAYGGYLLGTLVRSRRAGVLAAAVLVLEPGCIATNCLFFTETPYLCLNLFALYFLIRSARGGKLAHFLAGVLCVCGAAAFKGLALLTPLCVLPLALRRGVRPLAILRAAGLGALIFGLVFLPWCVRNQIVVGGPSPFPVSQGDQKLLGTYVGVGYPTGTYQEGITELDAAAWAGGYQNDPYRRIALRGEYAQQRLDQWLHDDPLGFIFTHAVYKPAALLGMHYYPQRVLGIPVRAAQYAWAGLLALALWGLTGGPPAKAARRPGFWTPALYVLVAVPLTAVYVPLARYNFAHLPFIALYAAVGLLDIWARLFGGTRAPGAGDARVAAADAQVAQAGSGAACANVGSAPAPETLAQEDVTPCQAGMQQNLPFAP